jgi:hypothetical protein
VALSFEMRLLLAVVKLNLTLCTPVPSLSSPPRRAAWQYSEVHRVSQQAHRTDGEAAEQLSQAVQNLSLTEFEGIEIVGGMVIYPPLQIYDSCYLL